MSRKSGRRPRAETAELVRRCAVRLLQERGLQGFANSVRLDDALALLQEEQGIRLTHGSVYGRIWSDQRDFQLDVVATTIGDYHGAEIVAALRLPPPDDEAAGAAAASSDGRRPSPAFASAFARSAAAARSSRPWNLWLGARTAVVSTPERDDDVRLAAALEAARRQVESSVAEALEDVLGPCADPTARAATFVTLLIGASLADDGLPAERLLLGLDRPEG